MIKQGRWRQGLREGEYAYMKMIYQLRKGGEEGEEEEEEEEV